MGTTAPWPNNPITRYVHAGCPAPAMTKNDTDVGGIDVSPFPTALPCFATAGIDPSPPTRSSFPFNTMPVPMTPASPVSEDEASLLGVNTYS